MSSVEMAEGGSAADTSPSASVEDCTSSSSSPPQMVLYPRSPPKAEVDDSPLQKSMDRNKESLKVKLMLRRPINQLVAQGIMPQLKTSPTIHEQRQKLERAKMGDLLKAKIQQRPDRQELVRQHILEADVGHVDPSLAERQRMLKKCRLVDSLNDQLSHRPGPLELIKKNILHTEEPIERAVKEGFIEFKATCEGHQIRPEPPDHYMTIDDDSQSSDAQSPNNAGNAYNVDACSSSSPAGSITAIVGGTPLVATGATAILQPMVTDGIPAELFRTGASVCDALEKAAAQAGIVTVVVAPNANILAAAPSPLSSSSSTSSLSPLSSVASPASVGNTAFTCSSPSLSAAAATVTPSLQPHRPSSLPAHQQLPAPGKDKNRKKSKSKSQQQKTRQIKFHEYKGPPNAQKNSNSSNNTGSNMETSYELLLHQQQLYLQCELEAKQKGWVADQNPASSSLISLPSSSVSSQRSANESSSQPALNPPPPPPPLPPPPTPASTAAVNKPLRNLEDMKVSDLKAELKKRNLRVSGPKPHLIERLKLYAGVATNNVSNNNVITNQNHVQSSSNLSIPFTTDDSIADSPRLAQTNAVTPMNGVETSHESNAKSTSPSPLNQNHVVVDITKTKGVTPTEMNNNEPSEDIIREKERQIKELQRQLLNSQLLLQKQRQQQQQMLELARSTQTFQPQQTINAKANLAAFLHQHQLAQELQKQIQLQQQQQIQLTVMNGNAGSHEPETSDSLLAAHNVNVARNINNNIVIKSDGGSNGTTTTVNGVFSPQLVQQRSNAVILGEHPATLVLNHVIKSDGNHQSTTSLPNFVGTFVQPHLVFSSETMKPFVFDSNALVIPQQVKVENGPVDDSMMTTTTGDAAVITNSTPTVDGHKVTIVSGDGENDYVTLHVSQDGNMVDNEFDPLGQNDDISKLFKQQPNAEHSVDDVLQLLINSGEFHPPESEPSPASAQFDVTSECTAPQIADAKPATTVTTSIASQPTTATDSTTSMYTTTSSSTDLNVPSQHLSLEELGIEVETFPMDLGDEEQPDSADTTGVAQNAELMDVDTSWLDRLISAELDQSTTNSSTSTNDNYESMLNNNVTDPLDFFSMDDNDFKIAAEFSWDRVDFATS